MVRNLGSLEMLVIVINRSFAVLAAVVAHYQFMRASVHCAVRLSGVIDPELKSYCALRSHLAVCFQLLSFIYSWLTFYHVGKWLTAPSGAPSPRG